MPKTIRTGQYQRRRPRLRAGLVSFRAAEKRRMAHRTCCTSCSTMSFSAMRYGGPIETPNMDRIAERGRAVHAVAHHRAVLANTLVPAHWARPHARRHGVHHGSIDRVPTQSGTIPPENGMLSEILGELGWNTYMVGKWHLCRRDDANLASTRRNWPSGSRVRALVWVTGRERTSGIRTSFTTTT